MDIPPKNHKTRKISLGEMANVIPSKINTYVIKIKIPLYMLANRIFHSTENAIKRTKE